MSTKQKSDEKKLTKFEKARILGARALQISAGAPFLVKLKDEDLKKIKYNPLEIAKKELEEGVLPLTVKPQELKKKS